MRGEINCERENNGLRGKIKGTRTKEENKRLRGGSKGAESFKEKVKKHVCENKMCNGWEK